MNRWRLIGLRVHLCLGVSAGLLLAVMGLTGALMAFEDELIDWLNPPRHTTLASTQMPALPYAQLLPALERQLKGQRITLLQADESAAIIVGFTAAGKATRLLADRTTSSIKGEVRGAAFFTFVRQIHRWLAIPGQANGPGRSIIGVAALCLVLLASSGLWLAWKRLPPKTEVKASWRDRRLYRGWHLRFGLWLAPVLLWSALTGLWWSFDWYRDGITSLLGGRAPTSATTSAAATSAASRATPRATAEQLGTAIDMTLSTLPGPSQRILLTLPRKPRQPLRLRRLPVNASHDRAYDEYRIDPATGLILTRHQYESQRLADKLGALMEPLHTGSWFGWPVRALLIVSSLALPGFAATGITMYILRRRRAKAGRCIRL
ncbi:PepSY-associated TM helix domain-containing protein [Advenella mimigardefordensis]|uniref:Putative membrane protein n=1 Tax=Advenella mimigardefordensis (strain DSM 17166 / LMG 22922 / DPN7) TaxID=1247726 RepID=W0P9H2_ADVMD|nr:PepSY-associated TM helix domain-containing protein [Advenella mimigardefordensis]AHG63376.1 putative membrane protein [Advenella mimigardefordensis DPN7]